MLYSGVNTTSASCRAAPPAIPDWLPEKWQSIVDTVAELANVPAGLVMRVDGDDIEVLVSSRTLGNPYKPGETMRLVDSGLYCEEVIKSQQTLAVPNALADEHWRANPDVELDMVSYLGMPIRWPDENAFGTICILDSRERSHSEVYEKLLGQFRDIIEHHLSLIYTDTQRVNAFDADRRRHDEALRSSEQRFRMLVEHAAEDFILHDAEGSILDVNEHACGTSGFTKEHLRQSSIGDLSLTLDGLWTANVWRAAQPGQTGTFDTIYKMANGETAHVEIRWSCQLLQGEKLFIILVRDVSERHRAEEAIRAAEAEVARASRLTMMGQLAGSIIHEINQPLAAIVTRAEACMRWLDRDEPRVEQARESVRLLARSAHDATEIVAGLRSIARKSVTIRAELDAHEVITEALQMTARECAKAGTTRTIELEAGPAAVIGDRTQIKQVALNLILNALEAMKEAGGRANQLAVRSARNAAGGLVVSFEDTGTGLMGKSPDRLFDPLFTTKVEGMGMGLAICWSIMQSHGGSITVQDRDDQSGVRFEITFPSMDQYRGLIG